MNGFVIAGTASGVGKTVATLVVIRALENAGKRVQPAKSGPDFIDPSHLRAVANRPARTLDVWLEGTEGIRRTYYRGEGDVCVVEGVMGLYDGEHSSTAAVAEALDLPVILVIDAMATSESVGAIALGFREYANRIDRDIDVVGVIAQRAGGGRHSDAIRRSLPDDIEYFGRIPDREELAIPSRHLGLALPGDESLDTAALDSAAGSLETEKLLDVGSTPPVPDSREPLEGTENRIAVASGDGFRFVYPSVLERLHDGATVCRFDPVAGEDLPRCDGVYIPGGYPERFGDELADCRALQTIRDEAADGLPVLGECGGLMVLAEQLRTADGETHSMAGILPATVEMQEHYQALDHVELAADRDTLTARSGESIRGHEFHYSRIATGRDADFAFSVKRGSGIDGTHDGLQEYSTLGTYAHVHAESGAFDRFLEAVDELG
ncbi:MAG: cobyrinate a,c-diamide synthase [Halodesulfurarchaeum sp.]